MDTHLTSDAGSRGAHDPGSHGVHGAGSTSAHDHDANDDGASGASPPRTSLIICTRDRPGLLADSVQSILTGTRKPTELVIIDQSSSPAFDVGVFGIATDCQIRHIPTRSAGLSRARNEGIAAARHELIAFTDDDVRVAPTWFETLVNAAVMAGPRAVVTGQVLPASEGRDGGFVPSTKVDPNPATFRGRIGADVIYPHNMALYRSALEEVGPFDTRLGAGGRFPAAEDNDFCHRLLEAGYEIRYLPEAIVHHRAWRSYRHYLPLRWAYGRGQGAYYAKYLGLRDPYMLRRLGSETLARTVRIFRRWRSPLGAVGEAVQLVGLLSAAAEWLITERENEAE